MHELTPAGRQVERALQSGYTVAACNLYYANLRDNVPMVVGDQPSSVSVWPEWHQMIQERAGTDDAPTIGEEVANEEADALGLAGNYRGAFVAERIDELNAIQPSIIDRTIRNDNGEVVDIVKAINPNVDR